MRASYVQHDQCMLRVLLKVQKCLSTTGFLWFSLDESQLASVNELRKPMSVTRLEDAMAACNNSTHAICTCTTTTQSGPQHVMISQHVTYASLSHSMCVQHNHCLEPLQSHAQPNTCAHDFACKCELQQPVYDQLDRTLPWRSWPGM